MVIPFRSVRFVSTSGRMWLAFPNRARRLHLSSPRLIGRPSEEPLRANGVSQNAIDAGPAEPSSILIPGALLMAVGAAITVGVFYFLSPGSSSRSGRAVRDANQASRRAREQLLGYCEEEETKAEREQEKIFALRSKLLEVERHSAKT